MPKNDYAKMLGLLTFLLVLAIAAPAMREASVTALLGCTAILALVAILDLRQAKQPKRITVRYQGETTYY